MLTKLETLLERGAQAESSRVMEPKRTALPPGSVSDFMVMGLVSRLSLTNHLACSISGLIQGSSWCHAHLQAKLNSSMSVCGGLARHTFSALLLSAPLKFSPLETTQTNGYYHAWLRQVVLVNGSLRSLLSILKCTLRPYLLGCV